jgi:predicted DNA-binding ribbon-helix-helix protein
MSKRKMKISRKSLIVIHPILIAGRKTSISVEDAFWNGLKEIARGRDMTLSDVVTAINSERKHNNLSSAIRLFVLEHYRRQPRSDRMTRRARARGQSPAD